ncbi:stealth family protein [Streptomyces sp. NPDC003393]
MVSLNNPEASALVSTYRSLVPVGARRRIVRRVPRPLRNAVMHLLASFDSLRSTVATRALGGSSSPARHGPSAFLRVVRHRGKHVRAVVVQGATEWAARARNLHILVALLEAAEIDYFCVRGTAQAVPCVAVSADQREEVEEILQIAFGRNPGYVSEGLGEQRDGASAKTWRKMRSHQVLRLAWNVCDPTGTLVFGQESGCDLEYWRREGDELVAPRPNSVLTQTPVTGERRIMEQKLFSPVPALYHTGYARSMPEFGVPLAGDHLFSIDVVYTWVDDSDPVWRASKDAARRILTQDAGGSLHEQAANDARYTSRDELRYSLRSIHQYAPWVHNIYLVTAGQVPRWLNTEYPGLRVVDHRDIFSDPMALPTFNSHAIESQLHHIEELSDHFLYLNDDVFFGRPVGPGHFFHPNGLTKFFMSKALIPSGEVSPSDLPVNAAGKNSRGLIAQQFGTFIAQKMKHTPHALRREVLQEIERTYPNDHWRTQHSKFRSPDDVPIASSLHHYHAFHTARATVGDLRYVYIDIGDVKARQRLHRLLARRDFDTFCINDTIVPEDRDAQERMVRDFLESYFPVPSPYELPAEVENARAQGSPAELRSARI